MKKITEFSAQSFTEHSLFYSRCDGELHSLHPTPPPRRGRAGTVVVERGLSGVKCQKRSDGLRPYDSVGFSLTGPPTPTPPLCYSRS